VQGKAPKDIEYNGGSYLKDENITVNYMFDSYRIGYFFKVRSNKEEEFRIGVTGKIRSAKIELVQNDTKKEFSNTGFVPLFYVSYEKALAVNWSVFSDMDFAAAPQGRAFDIAIKAKCWLQEDRFWGFGIRTLDGGADNDEVVTWSWFNYLVVDYAIRF
jgi:hypothetical protein